MRTFLLLIIVGQSAKKGGFRVSRICRNIHQTALYFRFQDKENIFFTFLPTFSEFFIYKRIINAFGK